MSNMIIFAQTDTTKTEFKIPPAEPLEYPFGNPRDTTRGVFGTDSRRDIKDVDGIDDFSRATGVIINKNMYKNNKLQCATLRTVLSRHLGVDKFDENVKFLNQPACGNCTGFLIAPDLFVTAGHCIETIEDAKNQLIVFGYKFNPDNPNATDVKPEDVYTVKEVVAAYFQDISTGIDYSILRLNRPSDRRPYRFRTGGNVSLFSNVYMIGSPSGLPLKFADDAYVVDNSNINWFKNNVDGFGGNSGGPVFNVNGFVEGIHARGAIQDGNMDYYVDKDCECIKTLTFTSATTNAGSQAHKITRIPLEIMDRAIYENIEYAIKKNDQKRLDDWLIYQWILNHEYTVKRGRLEFLAISNNNLSMLKKLLSISKDYNIKDNKGMGLIHLSIMANNSSIVAFLLNQGVSPNSQDNFKNTPLTLAVNSKRKPLVELLISRGANINLGDLAGNTPLHIAARNNDTEMIRLIVSKGADVKTRNNERQTPKKLARKSKSKEARKLIRKAEKGKLY